MAVRTGRSQARRVAGAAGRRRSKSPASKWVNGDQAASGVAGRQGSGPLPVSDKEIYSLAFAAGELDDRCMKTSDITVARSRVADPGGCVLPERSDRASVRNGSAT